MIDHLGLGRLFVLGVVSLLVFGPERLPELAGQAGRALRKLRQSVTALSADLRESSGIDVDELRQYDPRAVLREAMNPLEDPLADHVADLPQGTPALELLTSPDTTPDLPPGWFGSLDECSPPDEPSSSRELSA
jgi:sec-independent protein translocase protein TatB